MNSSGCVGRELVQREILCLGHSVGVTIGVCEIEAGVLLSRLLMRPFKQNFINGVNRTKTADASMVVSTCVSAIQCGLCPT